MDTFNFPVHTVTHVYPKGTAVQFGGGYQFATEPQKPVQRTFTLHFDGAQWFKNDDGTFDASLKDGITNIKALIDFYEAHYTNKTFIYPHEVFGNLNVKFSADQPLETPKSLPGGTGVTDAFDVVLIEQSA